MVHPPISPSRESNQPPGRNRLSRTAATVTTTVLFATAVLAACLAAQPANAAAPAQSADSGTQTGPIAGLRVALVVGNSNYKHVAALSNPSNDAELMARTLKGLGFKLIGDRAQVDLDKRAFDDIVQTFGSELSGAGVALFYYAGHGMSVNGENYLVPISANPQKESDLSFQMIATTAVLREMQDSGARLNIMILDACRNNPFAAVDCAPRAAASLRCWTCPRARSYPTRPSRERLPVTATERIAPTPLRLPKSCLNLERISCGRSMTLDSRSPRIPAKHRSPGCQTRPSGAISTSRPMPPHPPVRLRRPQIRTPFLAID